MTKLYFCKTNYQTDPPLDINLLILQLYKNKQILIIPAREQQEIRLENYLDKETFGSLPTICSWWDLDSSGLLNFKSEINVAWLSQFKAVVILDKDRVDTQYEKLLEKLISTLI